MRTIYSIGETTYDIIFRNDQPSHSVVGGSVLNTSVTLGRLGLPVHFVSRLGNDKIGDISVRFLKENGVDCKNIVRFEGNSRVALAFLDHDNNAEYQFYKAQQVPSLIFPDVKENDIITFGSTNAVRDEGRNDLLLFLNQAVDKRAILIYDPNIREFGKRELVEVRRKVEENLHLCSILKGSYQDFYRLYDTSDPEKIFVKANRMGVKVLIITAGDKPVVLKTEKISKQYPLEPVKAISTIGAGDNFTAGIITGLWKNEVNVSNLMTTGIDKWDEIVDFGNQLAAEVCKSDFNYISLNFAKTFSEQYLKS